jgi:hypothetical protein
MTTTDHNLGTEDIAQETAILDRLRKLRQAPPTFEEYRRQHDLDDDHPNLDGWRKVWERELQAEQNAPTVIPPCPDWCALPAGHGYDSTDGWDDDLTFERRHVAFEGKVAHVSATERNHSGEVTVGPLEVFIEVQGRDYPVDVVSAVAAELVEAADVLERLVEGEA